MLDRACAPVEEPSHSGTDISASIIFSGSFHAECLVEFPAATARIVANCLLGPEEKERDEAIIFDAVGELCNMIAGGWKQRLGASASRADLSVPCVSKTPAASAPPQPGTIFRTYAFDEASFTVTLTLE
jgi:chemotaxis protein CheX